MMNIPYYLLTNLATADLSMTLYSSVLCIAANRGMRNIPNYFLANLATADLGKGIALYSSVLYIAEQRDEEYPKLFPG
jgi:hypothetical protein